MAVGCPSNEQRVEPGIIGVCSVGFCFQHLLRGGENFQEFSVRQPGPHKPCFCIPDVPVVSGTFHKVVVVVRFPHGFGHPGDAPVVVGKLQCFGCRFLVLVRGNIPERKVFVQPAAGCPDRNRRLRNFHCFFLHGLVNEFGVESLESLEVCIGYNGIHMVAHHSLAKPVEGM